MTELSTYAEIKNVLEQSKKTGIDCLFTSTAAIELLGYIKSLEESIGLDSQRIADLESENKMLISEHYIITAIDMECQTREEKEYVGAFMTNAVKKIAELESELVQLKEANRWIPVGEKLPSERDTYFLVTGNELVSVGCYDLAWWGDDDLMLPFEVTHWRPLPEPQEAE
jgi:Protein of unknown function (DUF551)